jgi:proteasome lid subunit RPN8/RPN11
MNLLTQMAIHAHCLRDFPREACGLVIIQSGEELYVPCRNIARTPSEHFVMDPADYANAEERGEITTIVHSHPNMPARPSQGDLVACETCGKPWLIVAVWREATETTPRIVEEYLLKPTGYQAPLVGRQFFFGILDCYTLIQDWYQRERGMTLPNFERRDDFWNTKHGPQVDLYAQYEQVGFVDTKGDKLQVGDVPLMQIARSPFANHAGVYIGDGLLLHHMYGKLSSRDPYEHSMYQEKTRRVVRYAG